MSTVQNNNILVQKLISDSLRYQELYKASEAKHTKIHEFYITQINSLNAMINDYKSTIADKEKEIASLKQQNIKYLMDVGSFTTRNQKLKNDIKKLENEFKELNLKYEDSNINIHILKTENIIIDEKYSELYKKYSELQNKNSQLEYKNSEFQKKYSEFENKISELQNKNSEIEGKLINANEINMRNLSVSVNQIKIYHDENILLKQQLAQEKEKFTELQKILQATYEKLNDQQTS